MRDATARRPRRGRPTGDHESRRAELLAAVSAVLAEDGAAGTSLRKVAVRAGCTTGTLTYYFRNKEGLLVALAESHFDAYDALLAQAHAAGDVGLVFEQAMQWMDDPQFWSATAQLLLAAGQHRAVARVIRHRYGRYRAMFADILRRAQRAGTVRDDIAADVLADQLSAMGDGWTMLRPIEPKRFTPDRMRALLEATRILLTPPTSDGTR